MQVGGDEIVERSPKAIKRDFRALGRLVEGLGAQVVFSSIPSVAGNNTERGRKTHLVNRRLRDWCHRSNFGFFDHGEVYTALDLLATGASQLSQTGGAGSHYTAGRLRLGRHHRNVGGQLA